MAEIADKQGDTSQAKEYRRLSRQAKAAFAGTQYELREYQPLIALVVAAVDDAEERQQLEAVLEELVLEESVKKLPLDNLLAAIHRILDGERDQEVLCEQLNFVEESMIIYAILQGIADPQSLEALLE